MNQWDITFEQPAWEAVLHALRPGNALSAARFLTMMEQEPEEEVEAALEYLDGKDILLDISDLPAYDAGAQMEQRLQLEKQLVAQKNLPEGLDENDPLRLYLQELSQIPAFGDVQILAQKSKEGDENARTQLMNLLLSRVVEKAFALAGKGVLLLDLIQEGSLGLWQGIVCLNDDDAQAYLDRCIDRTLAKTVAMQARQNGVGEKMRIAMERYKQADEQLLTQLGRNPTLEEIALQLHMTLEETAAVEEMLVSARMMDRVRTDTQPKQQPDDDRAVEDTAYFQMRQRIEELLGNLEQEDARLLTLRFGLEGGLPLSAEETAKKLGITTQQAVAREAAALAKLRNS